MNKKSILVIDDDADILDAIRLTLEEEGYLVSTSRKAEHVDSLTQDNLPDLIILDVLLSGSDGRTVSKKLKENPLTKKIPIILVSADATAKSSFGSSLADDFISKPFDISDLFEKVEKHLKYQKR